MRWLQRDAYVVAVRSLRTPTDFHHFEPAATVRARTLRSAPTNGPSAASRPAGCPRELADARIAPIAEAAAGPVHAARGRYLAQNAERRLPLPAPRLARKPAVEAGLPPRRIRSFTCSTTCCRRRPPQVDPAHCSQPIAALPARSPPRDTKASSTMTAAACSGAGFPATLRDIRDDYQQHWLRAVFASRYPGAGMDRYTHFRVVFALRWSMRAKRKDGPRIADTRWCRGHTADRERVSRLPSTG